MELSDRKLTGEGAYGGYLDLASDLVGGLVTRLLIFGLLKAEDYPHAVWAGRKVVAEIGEEWGLDMSGYDTGYPGAEEDEE